MLYFAYVFIAITTVIILLMLFLKNRTFLGRFLSFHYYIVLIVIIILDCLAIAYAFTSTENEIADKLAQNHAEFNDSKNFTPMMRFGVLVTHDPESFTGDKLSYGPNNGLNLMLINDIKTEGFIKEYLTITAKASQGELDDYKYHMTVGGYIGTNVAETSYYSEQFPVPSTWLKPEKGKPVWNKENNYTLTDAGKTILHSQGFNSNPETCNTTGRDNGPFQQQHARFQDEGGSYPPAKGFNPSGESGHKSSVWYFPDELVAVGAELDSSMRYLVPDKLVNKEQELAMLHSGFFNEGERALIEQELGLKMNSPKEDITASANEMYQLFEDDYKQNKDAYAKIINGDPQDFKWAIAMNLVVSGKWKFSSSDSISYVTGNMGKCQSIWKQMFPDKPFTDFSSKVNDRIPSKSPLRTNYGMLVSVGTKYDHSITIIGAQHQIWEAFLGDIEYANMLKLAGVGVDPLNPATYTNSSSNPANTPVGGKPGEGAESGQARQEDGGGDQQWKPQGGNSPWWISRYHIDTSKLSQTRYNYIQNAFKFLGWPYAQIRPIPTSVKQGYLDCSALCCWACKMTVGKMPGTYTNDMTPNLKQISWDQLKPGDLLFFGSSWGNTDHVGIYLSGTDIGTMCMLNEPSPGKVCRVACPWGKSGAKALESYGPWYKNDGKCFPASMDKYLGE